MSRALVVCACLVLVVLSAVPGAGSATAAPTPASAAETATTAEQRRAVVRRCRSVKREARARLRCCRRAGAKLRRACLRARTRRAPAARRQAPRAPEPAPTGSGAPAPVATPQAPLVGPVLPPLLGRYLSVGAREFSYTLSRPVVGAGEVTFELRNQGEDPHNLVVSPGGTHDVLAELTQVASEGGVATQRVGLARGSYYLWCSIEFHEDAGMHATLRVE